MKQILWWSRHEDFLEILEYFQWNCQGIPEFFQWNHQGTHPAEYFMVLDSSNILIFDLFPKIQEHYI
jgi:hypothetical protein